MLVSLFFYFLSLYFRSKRWVYLLKTTYKIIKVNFTCCYFWVYGKQFNTYRIGELLRSYYLSIRENISTSFAFGTIIIERVMDVIALIVFFSIGAQLEVYLIQLILVIFQILSQVGKHL